jgi:hypothetical protein
MWKVLGAIAVLAAFAGCGSSDPEPSAATTPTPTPTPEPAAPQAKPAGYVFEKGHSKAVRRFYAGAHADPADDGSNAAVEEEYHQPPKPATGGLGDAITLTGTNIGVRIRVTPTAVVDPASAARPPRAGTRFVAVRLRMKSTGITILDSPVAEALLAYGGARKAEAVLGVKSECSNGFHDTIRVDVGNSARGCVLFEVPEGRQPRQLQLALEYVPAEVGGRWRLR